MNPANAELDRPQGISAGAEQPATICQIECRMETPQFIWSRIWFWAWKENFSTKPDQVLLFDSFTARAEEDHDKDLSFTEEDWMNHHLQSSLQKQPVAHEVSSSSGF